MQCKEVREKLYEYIYEELDYGEKAGIEEHLTHCTECIQEYLSLKKLLIEDMKDLRELSGAIIAPKELSQNIKLSLRTGSPYSIWRYAAAACILIFMFYAVPVAAYYVVENTSLSKYIDFDKGLVSEIEEGKLQILDKNSTMKDITFKVDGIIRKPDKTTVLFTLKVPKNRNINYAMPSGDFNVVTIKDQFGTKYRTLGSSMSLKSSNKDGEVTAIMDFEALKFWSYKLSINITAMETGTMTAIKDNGENPRADEKGFVYDIKEDRTVYGSWKVDFYVDRSINNNKRK